jgi:hypothetical protein
MSGHIGRRSIQLLVLTALALLSAAGRGCGAQAVVAVAPEAAAAAAAADVPAPPRPPPPPPRTSSFEAELVREAVDLGAAHTPDQDDEAKSMVRRAGCRLMETAPRAGGRRTRSHSAAAYPHPPPPTYTHAATPQESLLHWAIEHSDPDVLAERAGRQGAGEEGAKGEGAKGEEAVVKEFLERKQRVKEVRGRGGSGVCD